MLVNQIVPLEIKERICIHCNKIAPDEEPVVYLVAEKGQGKSTETIRQAVFRRDTILSNEYDFYRSAGMKHANEAKPEEVSYLGLRDVFSNPEENIHHNFRNGALHLCVDNARTILEELLTDRFGVPVKIDFMSLEA